MDHFKSVNPQKFYQDVLSCNVRPDGRKLDEFRNVSVNIKSLECADGSAIVRIGNTTVICGIKAELGEPHPDAPDSGFLLVNAELPPLCSPAFRPGPPSERAQALTAYLHALLASTMDVRQLCVERERLVWTLYCDAICIDYDGCVTDACVAAFVAAALTTRLPHVQYDRDTGATTLDEEECKALNIISRPVATTFAIFEDDRILVDPCGEEELLALCVVTVVVSEGELQSVHKPGGAPSTEAQLQKCINLAKERAQLINKLIDKAFK